jgi:membrane protein DedA with SNARE-associated domain
MDHYLAEYGYSAIVFVVALEYLGVPLPGETILIAAGIYAGDTHHLALLWIVVSAFLAALAGSTLGFVIGLKGGYPLLRRYGRHLRIDEGRIKLGRYLFQEHGGKVVFASRFVTILRTYAAFLAGTNRMPWRRFAAVNLVSAASWATLFGVGSYQLGDKIDRLSSDAGIALAISAALALVAGVVVVRRREAHLLALAEQAFPGPLDEQVVAR